MKKLVSLLLLAGILQGCATDSFLHNRGVTQTAMADVDKDYGRAAERAPISDYSVKKGFWVNGKATDLPENDEARLPAALTRPTSLNYNPRASLRDLASQVTTLTGLRINFADDAASKVDTPLLGTAFVHRDSLRALLDIAAARAGLYWKMQGGEVLVFRQDTRIFDVSAITGTTKFKAELGSKQTSNAQPASSGTGTVTTGTGSTSQTGHSMTVENGTNAWEGIKNDVRQLISGDGKFSISESNGTVTVTATPVVLRTVEAYVRTANEKARRAVAVTVRVYAVNHANSDNYGVNWSAAYQNLSRYFKVNYASGALTSGANALTAMIVNPGKDDTWDTSQMIIQAVSKNNGNRLLTESSNITVSGEPVPVHVTREVSYLASITTTAVANAGTSTALVPGTVTIGFSMNLLPKIVDGSNVFLQAAIELSSLDRMASITSAGQTIQVPEKSLRSFLQKVPLKSGQTLVLGGFQQSASTYSQSGTGSSDFIGAGGEKISSGDKTTIVVLITPYIMSQD